MNHHAHPQAIAETEPHATFDAATALDVLHVPHARMLAAPLAIGGSRETASAATTAPPGGRSLTSSIAALLGIGAATLLAATLGARVIAKNKAWYRSLQKPSFTPPDAVFGLVWPPLYAASAYSAWRVWRTDDSTARTAALGLWGAQMLFNGAWSPLFFGEHRPKAALADLVANFASLGVYAAVASRVDKPAAGLVAPYLGWLAFAGAVNLGTAVTPQVAVP